MMRRAATDVLRTRGNGICSRAPVVGSSVQSSTHNVLSPRSHHRFGAGVLPPQRRQFVSNTSNNKAPTTPPSQQPGASSSSVRGPTPAPKDKGQEAIEKSERLHAELKEVRSFFVLIQIIISVYFFTLCTSSLLFILLLTLNFLHSFP